MAAISHFRDALEYDAAFAEPLESLGDALRGKGHEVDVSKRRTHGVDQLPVDPVVERADEADDRASVAGGQVARSLVFQQARPEPGGRASEPAQ